MCALNFTIAFAFEVKHTGRNNNIREIIIATSDLAPCALGNYLRVVPPRPVRTLYRGVEEVVHSLALLQNNKPFQSLAYRHSGAEENTQLDFPSVFRKCGVGTISWCTLA